MTWRLVISGAPRTKKTSNRLVKAGTRTVVLPSAYWLAWVEEAAITANGTPWHIYRKALPAKPMNATALFYRDAARGDAVGYYQGLADLLEKRGVIPNDKWLVSWDGSRLLVDPKCPRVELTLTAAA